MLAEKQMRKLGLFMCDLVVISYKFGFLFSFLQVLKPHIYIKPHIKYNLEQMHFYITTFGLLCEKVKMTEKQSCSLSLLAEAMYSFVLISGSKAKLVKNSKAFEVKNSKERKTVIPTVSQISRNCSW